MRTVLYKHPLGLVKALYVEIKYKLFSEIINGQHGMMKIVHPKTK